MDAIIIVFVMATGFVAVTAVLPILFWITQNNTFDNGAFYSARTRYTLQFQTKPLPPFQFQQTSYTSQASGQSHRGFQVKALPPYSSVKHSSNRRIAVAS